MNKFIRVFTNEKEANSFARKHGARAVVTYDWDFLIGKMIKQFVVKY